MSSTFKKTFLKHFPAPSFLTMPTVALEVSPEAVRFLELSKGSREKEVLKHGEVLLPSAENDEDFPSGQRLEKIVSDIRDKNHLKFIRAVLPEDKAYLFSTDMPKLRESEIRNGLELKLEENIPIPAKETVFDYDVVKVKENNRLHINVTAATRLVVERYLKFFKNLNLIPMSFEVAAQATARAVVPKNDRSTLIVMNFGIHRTSFSIVSEGNVYFTSSIDMGGSSLTESVSKYMKISSTDAEAIKEEKGITKDKDNLELFFAMASSLSVLKDEINKLSTYWNTHQDKYTEHSTNVSKVIMCGRESALKGFADYMAAGISIPVELANVWVNVRSTEEYLPPIPFKDSLNYAAVIGMSI